MKAFLEYKNSSLAVDLVVFGYHNNILEETIFASEEEINLSLVWLFKR